MAAIAVAAEIVGPALEGLADVTKALGAAAFRSDSERAKRREAAEKRLTDDINYMVEQPFKILNEAAQKWYDAWDSNLRDIAQTQGNAMALEEGKRSSSVLQVAVSGWEKQRNGYRMG